MPVSTSRTLVEQYSWVHLVRVTPFDAMLGKDTLFRTPIAEAKTHATRLVAQPFVGFRFNLIVYFLPKRCALNFVKVQRARTLILVFFIADMLNVDKAFQLINMLFHFFLGKVFRFFLGHLQQFQLIAEHFEGEAWRIIFR